MKKTIIFIDTNKYLDFFRASDHSLKMLDILIGFIEKSEIGLILPKQVVNEFMRDKDNVFKEFVDKNLRDIKVPGFMDKKRIEKVNKLLFSIKKDYEKKFYSSRSKINIKIKKIFDLSIKPEEINEILEKAYYRTLRGNPPRKNNNSFGDAIIWETLLQDFSSYDLTIISGDGDWSSEINKKEINPFLEEEWGQKKYKKIKLFDTLGEFINVFSKKEKIKKEAIQEEKYLNVLSAYSVPIQTVFSANNAKPYSTILASDVIPFDIQSDYLGKTIPNKGYCNCCGEEYDVALGVGYSFGKCSECSKYGNSLIGSTGKKCDKCGKHYHEPFFPISAAISSVSSLSYIGNICEDCKKVK